MSRRTDMKPSELQAEGYDCGKSEEDVPPVLPVRLSWRSTPSGWHLGPTELLLLLLPPTRSSLLLSNPVQSLLEPVRCCSSPLNPGKKYRMTTAENQSVFYRLFSEKKKVQPRLRLACFNAQLLLILLTNWENKLTVVCMSTGWPPQHANTEYQMLKRNRTTLSCCRRWRRLKTYVSHDRSPTLVMWCKQEVDWLLCSWLLSNRNSSEGGAVMVKSQSRDDEVELLLTGSVTDRKCYWQEVLLTGSVCRPASFTPDPYTDRSIQQPAEKAESRSDRCGEKHVRCEPGVKVFKQVLVNVGVKCVM